MQKIGRRTYRSAVALLGAVLTTLLLLSPLEAAGAPLRAPSFPTTQLADGRQVGAGRIIVGYHPSVPAAERAQLQSDVAVRGIPRARILAALGPDAEVVDVSGAASIDAALQVYRADPRVRYAEPDSIAHAFEVPNDPSFSSQWGMTKIQAPTAWNTTHGSTTVQIAILDCGIYEVGSVVPPRTTGHPDINGKVDLRQDFTGSATGTDDLCRHGTHVAGIAAANTNNGIGVAGVGYNTHLLNGKVLDDTGSGLFSWVDSGIYWAADHGARVINMSLGAQATCGVTEQDAINYAWAHNVVVVAAAGNTGNSNPVTPASCAHVLSVASTGPTDARSSFSTFGTWVSVAAPGENIFSTYWDGTYANLSGTSMATPHVSGLVALVWATGFGTSNQAVVDRITSTADHITGTGTLWQSGRINAAAAVAGSVPTVGGKNLKVTAATSVPVQLAWQGGTAQDSYAAMRIDYTTGVTTYLTGGFLPAGATAASDPGPLKAGDFYCYVILPFKSGASIGMSDELCILWGSRSATGFPTSFGEQLNQSPTATLTWGASGAGEDGYLLLAYPLNGGTPRQQTLAAGTTSATDATGGTSTCYLLVATKAGAVLGTTDWLCPIPGVATLAASARQASLTVAQVQTRLSQAAPPRVVLPGSRPSTP